MAAVPLQWVSHEATKRLTEPSRANSTWRTTKRVGPKEQPALPRLAAKAALVGVGRFDVASYVPTANGAVPGPDKLKEPSSGGGSVKTTAA